MIQKFEVKITAFKDTGPLESTIRIDTAAIDHLDKETFLFYAETLMRKALEETYLGLTGQEIKLIARINEIIE